jgi:hypothetical protein
MRHKWYRFFVAVMAGLVGAGLLAAQSQDEGGAAPVSNQIVAHLSALRGNVTTQRGDTGEWVAGAINAPLVTGDKVAAGAGARAEVQMDYANTLRLGDNAQANLVELDNNQISIQLGSGLADYITRGGGAPAEIDTPNVAIRPRGASVLRILVDSDGETQVIAREGSADISTPQGSTQLKQGQQITVEGTDSPQFQITDAPGRDSWDEWNRDRDNALEQAQAMQHTNRYYTGAAQMDGYGYWTYVPGYGQVWVPNEPDSWTPYSNGRWDWQPYWGWTWVGYEPWGWTPYHYGRWFVYGPRWVWWPGPVTPYYRPYWAPAYVSFFGWGGGVSIGWLPVGPCDYWHPWWGVGVGVGFRFGARIHPLAVVSHERIAYSNLNMMRTDVRVRNAVIRVPRNEFARGGVQGRVHVSANEVNHVQALNGRVALRPEHGALGVRAERPATVPHEPTRFFGTRGTVVERPAHGPMQARAPQERAPQARAPQDRPPQARAPQERTPLSPRGFERAPQAAPREAQPAPQARPGWQRFGGPPQAHAPAAAAPERQAAPQRPGPPHEAAPAPRGGGGWQHFEPQPRSEAAPGRPAAEARPQYQPRFRPPAESRAPEARPPLRMNDRVMTAPRESAPPRMQAPRMEAPRMEAPRSAPPAREARPGGGGGGSHPAARPGGGGGGGGHPHTVH